MDGDPELSQEEREELQRLRAEVQQLRDEIRRIEQSVTIQLYRKLRARLYGAIGEESLLGRVIQASLRLAGRILIRSRDELVGPPWTIYSSLAESVPRRPRTFNEKVRYKMLHDRRPLLTTFADKVAIRDYVAQKVGADLLSELYLLTEDPEEVREDSLPREFAIKASHGAGAVVVVADQAPPNHVLFEGPAGWTRFLVSPDRLDWARLRELCREWMGLRYQPEWEWAYTNVPPRILAEELLLVNGSIPQDLRFFVFHGRVRVVQIDFDRFGHRVRTFYSPEWVHLPVTYNIPRGPEIARPGLLEEMISIAERLGQETDFVRVDLYDLGDRIVFGEMTNYPAAGGAAFDPPSFGRELGSWWSLPKRYQ